MSKVNHSFWVVVNSTGVSLVAESGQVYLFTNLEIALLHAYYETDGMGDKDEVWNAHQVTVDEELYEECAAYGNVI